MTRIAIGGRNHRKAPTKNRQQHNNATFRAERSSSTLKYRCAIALVLYPKETMMVHETMYIQPNSPEKRNVFISGGNEWISPPTPPTRDRAVITSTRQNGIRIEACRKSVTTTAQSPPTTQ